MKADLHVHSTYSSDGRSTPQQIVESAKKQGLGCVAVTDHNQFKAFADLEDNGEIIVIPAEEVTSDSGHILALGIDRHIERGHSIEETIRMIHEAGGIAIAAHPYRWWSGLGQKNVRLHAEHFDGVEARNGRSTKKDNGRSERLAAEIGKFITAGSDAHNPKKIGFGYVDLPDDCKDWKDVIQAIKDGKSIPHSGNRKALSSVKYSFMSVLCWALRGFHRM